MSRRYFVTGTGTDIGKTYVTSLILQKLASENHRVLGVKPLSLGSHEDGKTLLSASNMPVRLAEVSPFYFPQAAAPNVAFEQTETTVTAKELIAACEQVIRTQRPDVALIEGSGGYAVPLSRNESMMDVACGLTDQVILVVGMRLGCQNLALLTYQAIRNSGMKQVFWISNQVDPEMPYYQENLAFLKTLLPIPYLGEVSYGMSWQNFSGSLELMGS